MSYLISNGINEPTLFDASEKSKIVKFSLKDKDYNAYLKYISAPRVSIRAEKTYFQWDIVFTNSEKNYLTTSFVEEGKENIVVLVCSNENFKDTYFAIIGIKNALKCLGNDSVNEQTRITIKRQKGSKYVYCYGTALSDKNAIELKYNFDEYFGFNE